MGIFYVDTVIAAPHTPLQRESLTLDLGSAPSRAWYRALDAPTHRHDRWLDRGA
jgi:hypothetical protein